MGASAAAPEQTEPGGRVPRKSCRARTGQFERASSARAGLSPARADQPGRDGNAPGPGRLEGQLTCLSDAPALSYGSSTVRYSSPFTFSSFCRTPLGHAISIDFNTASLPVPKNTVRSLELP